MEFLTTIEPEMVCNIRCFIFFKFTDLGILKEICVICRDDINARTFVKINCGHMFHDDCYTTMMLFPHCGEKRKCPLCLRENSYVCARTEKVRIMLENMCILKIFRLFPLAVIRSQMNRCGLTYFGFVCNYFRVKNCF